MSYHTYCANSCRGQEGYDGGCCTIEDRDYIIGRIEDWKEFLQKTNKTFSEVFMTYEEGSKLFPDKSIYQDPGYYPAFRLNFLDKRLPCIFYRDKKCTVYSIRPRTCRSYVCNYLADVQAQPIRIIK